MKQVIVNDKKYTAIRINTDILLTDENLSVLYKNFRTARENGSFDESFSEYCRFCFATGAGLYLLEASRISDRSMKAVLVHENPDFDEGGLIFYGN